jgi:hypothetical protein
VKLYTVSAVLKVRSGAQRSPSALDALGAAKMPL